MNRSKVISGLVILFFLSSCYDQKQLSEVILRHYIDKNEKLIRSHFIKDGLAVWESSIRPGDENYRRLVKIQLDYYQSKRGFHDGFIPERFALSSSSFFSEERNFQVFKKLRSSGLIDDSILSRQLDVLCHAYMDGQVESDKYKELVECEVLPVQKFSNFKIHIDGEGYSEIQVDSIRRNTTDASIFKKIYESRREVAKEISGDIIRMVKLRNEYARNCGYKNYYELSLELQDQDIEAVDSLLIHIEKNTNRIYAEAKRVVDKSIAKRLAISVAEVKPWHYVDERYQFYPVSFSSRMDGLYGQKDVVTLASEYFKGIGLAVDDVIKQSDLEYREGKSVVSGVINIDFKNDVRMLGCIKNDTRGIRDMMHLCGAAAYYKSIEDSIPYLLKSPSLVISKGISVFFENLPVNYHWLCQRVKIDPEMDWLYKIIAQHSFQVDKIFKCRTLLVMALFEKAIYEDPDQDLSKLWWSLNQKYMLLAPPDETYEYDWACTRFATMLSCDSQNYLFAEMFAAQLRHTLEERKIAFENDEGFGEFLIQNVFAYGNIYPWEQLIENATGEPLTSDYLIKYMMEKEARMKPNSPKVHAMK